MNKEQMESIVAEMIVKQQGAGCSRRGCRATCSARFLIDDGWTMTEADHGRDWWCARHSDRLSAIRAAVDEGVE